MNAIALKKTELVSELSRLPERELDKVRDLIASILDTTKRHERSPRSLRGIWKGKGFERIDDIEAALREVKQELGATILNRRIP